jgi:hypothetical protein
MSNVNIDGEFFNDCFKDFLVKFAAIVQHPNAAFNKELTVPIMNALVEEFKTKLRNGEY